MTRNRRSGDSNTWTVTRAKACFSELIAQAQTSREMITQHGERRAVMDSAQEWVRQTERKSALAEFLLTSPLEAHP